MPLFCDRMLDHELCALTFLICSVGLTATLFGRFLLVRILVELLTPVATPPPLCSKDTTLWEVLQYVSVLESVDRCPIVRAGRDSIFLSLHKSVPERFSCGRQQSRPRRAKYQIYTPARSFVHRTFVAASIHELTRWFTDCCAVSVMCSMCCVCVCVLCVSLLTH